MRNLSSSDIAWISCEPSDYPDSFLPGALSTLELAINRSTIATIFYSVNSSYCNYTAGQGVDSGYSYIFSMVQRNVSEEFANAIDSLWNQSDSGRINARIARRSTLQQGSGNGTSGGGSGGTGGQNGGPGPSTATAMVILYSITGVITALFLIIIVTGAIRAHRHPERYGPRAVLGRARQSRAKGLARAMLDSIPIVKFGDTEEGADATAATKPGDVEMVAGASTDPQASGAAAATGTAEGATTTRSEKSPAAADTTAEGTADAPATSGKAVATGVAAAHAHDHDHDHRHSEEEGIQADTTGAAPKPAAATNDNSLGCSICTEDFERGEDVRVLPCDHKFHPACIDPWLLNVSGTCPLW